MNDKNLVSSEDKAVKLALRRAYATPAVDIYEQDSVLTLVADLPGVKLEQLQIDVDQGILTLEAQSDIKQSGERLLNEYSPSGYYRQFRLPEHLNLEKVEAQLDNGVLTLKLPKSEQALPKRIEVKTLH